MNDNYLIVIAVVGAVATPIISILGLLLQHRRERLRDIADEKKKVADAEELEATADKIRAEAKLIDRQADKDTINFWIGMVETLRKEVNSLTELSRQNGGELATLRAKLVESDTEKIKLIADNERLTLEVESLRKEVSVLKKQLSDKKGE
jgi:lambda repressor-like predicted transcriptional regulator